MTSGFKNRIGTLIMLLICSTQVGALQLNARSEFVQRFELNAAVSGVVSQVFVQIGQRVNQGEVLLELDNTAYQAEVNRAQALIKSLQPAQIQMQSELEKAQELFDRDSLSMIDLQQAENNLLHAEGQLEAMKAVLQKAEYELAHTAVRAPIDGLVLAIKTHTQRFINTQVDNQTLVTLVDNREMLAVAPVSADNWHSSLVGKSAEISFRGKKYQGKVVELAFDHADKGSSEPAFEVRVLFVASGEIPANMPLIINIPE